MNKLFFYLFHDKVHCIFHRLLHIDKLILVPKEVGTVLLLHTSQVGVVPSQQGHGRDASLAREW